MTDLLLHPATRYELQALILAKPHAVLITGNRGAGKNAVANELIAKILGKMANKPENVLRIEIIEKGIGIDEIRRIRDYTSRKTIGTQEIRRVILIIDAHTMTAEAQNALLKTLEEPPADTMIVLTTDDLTALKYTIRSRAHQLHVLPVSLQAATEYFTTLDLRKAPPSPDQFISAGSDLSSLDVATATSPSVKPLPTRADLAWEREISRKSSTHNRSKSDIAVAYHMSDGQVGLLSSLLENSLDHELVAAIARAKDIITMSPYQRLIQVDALSKQKDQTQLLLQGIERVAMSGLRSGAQKNAPKTVQKFYNLSRHVAEARSALGQNANTKLVLVDLFLNI